MSKFHPSIPHVENVGTQSQTSRVMALVTPQISLLHLIFVPGTGCVRPAPGTCTHQSHNACVVIRSHRQHGIEKGLIPERPCHQAPPPPPPQHHQDFLLHRNPNRRLFRNSNYTQMHDSLLISNLVIGCVYLVGIMCLLEKTIVDAAVRGQLQFLPLCL